MALLRDEQSGFGFPMLRQGQKGPLTYIQNDTLELIKASIKQIILTMPGERMMNPEFGCRLRQLHFEAISPTLKTTVVNVIYEALTRWEPRIEVTPADIVVQESKDIDSKLDIKIGFKVKNPDFIAVKDTSVYINI